VWFFAEVINTCSNAPRSEFRRGRAAPYRVRVACSPNTREHHLRTGPNSSAMVLAAPHISSRARTHAQGGGKRVYGRLREFA